MTKKCLRNHLILVISICITSIPFLISGCSNPQVIIETGSVTDIDGNVYETVKIGKQWWMAENLRVTNYQDGTPILKVIDGKEWTELTTSAYCAYENDYENIIPYGLLYNWYATVDERNICPEGWHVPTDEEWKELEMHLGMSQEDADGTSLRGKDIGGMLKQTGIEYWKEPNTGATNVTGLSIIPSGVRPGDTAYSGQFSYKGFRAPIWTSSEQDENSGLHRTILYNHSDIDRLVHGKADGLSVRCIQY